MAQVLVTGGAGFIGSHLTEALVAEGHQVRVLDDLSAGKLENLSAVQGKFVFERGSVTNESIVDSMAQGCEAVFHLAAVVSVQKSIVEPIATHNVNSLGTLVALEASKKAGARFIFSSSAAVYGDVMTMPIREDAKLNPISNYGAQKLYGEHLLSAASGNGAQGISLRYFNVYGPRQDPSSPYSGVISIFAERAMAGQPLVIYGDGKQTRDFVHVSDVVRANLAAMKAKTAKGDAVNVGTGMATNLLQLAQIAFRAAGRIATLRHEPARQGDIRRSYCDPSLARQMLGFSALVALDKGLADLVRYNAGM
ncbi:MAG: NAD-dependent epimerase/dehydratase family protein [Armatimonadetes bacterium]|nr:NAD-dependent epimerase/dehydratase family protein [Armatimonadota bacterium]